MTTRSQAQAPPSQSPPQTSFARGILELTPRRHGFLRDPSRNFTPRPSDPMVPIPLIERYSLKPGLLVGGRIDAGPSRGGPNGPRLGTIEMIEGAPTANFRGRDWEELTPVDPTQWLRLETGPEPLTTRVIDLFTPIGKGTRGLIVAPPRTGKTVLLAQTAQAILKNHPEILLIVLLVDERPEEVTDFRRTVKADVVASSNDQDPHVHCRTAEIVIERAKRLVEQGKDVVVLLDSITRLARAYNKSAGSGRTMSGGIDSRAMDIPKRLFGAARAFDEGGTLTILGTALVETNSRMDDVIFQEFKGTGNMELVLDRKLSDKRVYPAIDLAQSGTRKEERLLPAENLERINLLRRSLLQMRGDESMESLIKQLSKTKSNEEFLYTVGKFMSK